MGYETAYCDLLGLKSFVATLDKVSSAQVTDWWLQHEHLNIRGDVHLVITYRCVAIYRTKHYGSLA